MILRLSCLLRFVVLFVRCKRFFVRVFLVLLMVVIVSLRSKVGFLFRVLWSKRCSGICLR